MIQGIKILLSNCNNINKLKFVTFSLINSLFETISLAIIFSIILIYFQNSQKLDFTIISLNLNTINFNIIILSFVLIIIIKTIYLFFFLGGEIVLYLDLIRKRAIRFLNHILIEIMNFI